MALRPFGIALRDEETAGTRRELVLDAEPEPALGGHGPCAPLDLDLGALTALTRLELRGTALRIAHLIPIPVDPN